MATVTFEYDIPEKTEIKELMLKEAIQFFSSEEEAKNGPQGVLCIVTGV